MQRKATWVEDLYALVLSRQDSPYAWGTNDCCSFVGDAILAMTGTDVFADYRGTYTDEQSANVLMVEMVDLADKVKMVEYVTAQFDMPMIPVAFAQRGDVVLLNVDGGFALGIVNFDGTNVLAVAAEGLHKVSISHATRAWRV